MFVDLYTPLICKETLILCKRVARVDAHVSTCDKVDTIRKEQNIVGVGAFLCLHAFGKKTVSLRLKGIYN
jgi:hypothetical protein